MQKNVLFKTWLNMTKIKCEIVFLFLLIRIRRNKQDCISKSLDISYSLFFFTLSECVIFKGYVALLGQIVDL